MKVNLAIILILLFLSQDLHAEELSPIATDRPDVTESPLAIETGHFQSELSLFGFTKDGKDKTYDYLNINTKYGIEKNTDLQFLINTYREEKTPGNNSSSSFSDLGLRLKHNLVNDKKFALGILPYIIFPDHSDEADFGMALPMDFSLSDTSGIGAMTQLSRVDVETDDTWESLNTIVFGHDFNEKIASFLEIQGVFSDINEQYYLNHGLTYLLTPLVQVDTGFYHGLNTAADDFTFSLGLSFKS